MPKSKKPNKAGEEKQTWRKPVKLPAVSLSNEPMKSLYALTGDVLQEAPRVEPETDPSVTTNHAGEKEKAEGFQGISDFAIEESSSIAAEKPSRTASRKRKTDAEKPPPVELREVEKASEKLSETEFLRLLKTDKMDFYSLAEILRGSSMALYCVLYSESLAKGENRCQMRQAELMMRAGINNPATLYKQERWLTTLRLIKKTVRLGNHNGASYEVRLLETLPLPKHILEQFGGYLSEIIV